MKREMLVTSSPHIVHVVSILDVPRRFGSTSFQSNDVSGAQKSEFLFCIKESIGLIFKIVTCFKIICTQNEKIALKCIHY